LQTGSDPAAGAVPEDKLQGLNNELHEVVGTIHCLVDCPLRSPLPLLR
jgi:hypothetical protein